MSMIYNKGGDSTIGSQFNTYEYKRKALIETAKAEYFGQLGDAETLTKHFGQKMKKYHYLPLLDDRNINDQGLDANGAVMTIGTFTAVDASGVVKGTTYATNALAVTAAGVGGKTFPNTGNLYGSSKDPGVINGKLPVLSETGGRVNRVGFKRIEIEGEIADYGFFYEWSKDSLDFDTDKDLYTHINRESLRGAKEISEDIIQMDLLDAAGVIRYGGTGTTIATVNSIVTYNDLVKLGITFDDNRCPKDTKAIVGSQDTDVVNISAARYLFAGSEMIPTFMRMKDYHDEKAFVEVKNYAKMANGKYINALHGEVGAVAGWRIIIVPEMMQYKAQGATVASATEGATLLSNGTNIDVYPLLAVGSGSFAKINFQSSGKSNDKFQIIVRKPGTFANPSDPFEKIGYSSTQFWQGTMILRAEWIGKILTGAKA